MTRPDFRNQITLGNVLQIGAMLVAVVVAFTVLQANAAAQSQSIRDHELRLRAVEAQIAPSLARIEARLVLDEPIINAVSRKGEDE